MSRTYKDRHWKLRFPEEDNYVKVAYEAHPHTMVWSDKYRCYIWSELDYSKTVVSYTWEYVPGVKTKRSVTISHGIGLVQHLALGLICT